MQDEWNVGAVDREHAPAALANYENPGLHHRMSRNRGKERDHDPTHELRGRRARRHEGHRIHLQLSSPERIADRPD
jgi:hypothetical protein